MNKKIVFLLFILFISSIIVSCSDSVTYTPYIISEPDVHITKNSSFYEYAGIEFTFFNSSQKEITSFTISCMAYSATDNTNPFTGTNQIFAYFNEPISPQETKQLVINLDNRLYCIPTQKFIIDFFTVPSVHFADGSIWEDRMCQFFTRSY